MTTWKTKSDTPGWPKSGEEAEEGSREAIEVCSMDLPRDMCLRMVGHWVPHLCMTLTMRELTIAQQNSEIETLKKLLRSAKAWPAAVKSAGWYKRAQRALDQ